MVITATIFLFVSFFVMLLAGVVMAAAGTAVLFLTVDRSDRPEKRAEAC